MPDLLRLRKNEVLNRNSELVAFEVTQVTGVEFHIFFVLDNNEKRVQSVHALRHYSRDLSNYSLTA